MLPVFLKLDVSLFHLMVIFFESKKPSKYLERALRAVGTILSMKRTAVLHCCSFKGMRKVC